jgi:hypothetical protein
MEGVGRPMAEHARVTVCGSDPFTVADEALLMVKDVMMTWTATSK